MFQERWAFTQNVRVFYIVLSILKEAILSCALNMIYLVQAYKAVNVVRLS